MSKTYVLIPFYNDAESLRQLLKSFDSVEQARYHFFFIDDCSGFPVHLDDLIDESSLISASNAKILRLRTNVGHQLAIAIALKKVVETINAEDVIVIMDGDGEDPAFRVKEMVERCRIERRVIVAMRRKRSEGIGFRIWYLIYKFFFYCITGYKLNFGNFMALDSRSATRLSLCPTVGVHIASSLIVSKIDYKGIWVDRGTRFSGESKMSFHRLLIHGFRSMIVFSETIWARVLLFLLCTIVCFILVAVCVLAAKFFGLAVAGWTSIVLLITFQIIVQITFSAFGLLMLAGLLKANETSALFKREHELLE